MAVSVASDAEVSAAGTSSPDPPQAVSANAAKPIKSALMVLPLSPIMSRNIDKKTGNTRGHCRFDVGL
jgi:hypothetical protein